MLYLGNVETLTGFSPGVCPCSIVCGVKPQTRPESLRLAVLIQGVRNAAMETEILVQILRGELASFTSFGWASTPPDKIQLWDSPVESNGGGSGWVWAISGLLRWRQVL